MSTFDLQHIWGILHSLGILPPNQSHEKLFPMEDHLFSQGRSSLAGWLSFHGSYSQCD